ncbi:hypothetical protein C2E23DRAFT_850327, partial [Lenzites betulinus]
MMLVPPYFWAHEGRTTVSSTVRMTSIVSCHAPGSPTDMLPRYMDAHLRRPVRSLLQDTNLTCTPRLNPSPDRSILPAKSHGNPAAREPASRHSPPRPPSVCVAGGNPSRAPSSHPHSLMQQHACGCHTTPPAAHPKHSPAHPTAISSTQVPEVPPRRRHAVPLQLLPRQQSPPPYAAAAFAFSPSVIGAAESPCRAASAGRRASARV